MRQMHHAEIVARLKRAEGHLRSIIAMFETPRACADLVQQLHAVEKAIASAKTQLIHDHMEHCLAADTEEGLVDAREVLTQLKTLTKYL
ncbi:MAG: metal-sensing transcriptional repressor [Beijerinckiaceae bacterium]|nr:metal-sensing transcriptional repressor [Beijerinckiaceae bacterium]